MMSAPTPESRIGHRRLLRALRRGLLVVLALAGVLALVLLLRPKPLPVDVVPVTSGPMTVTVAETGRARVKNRYVVSAPVAGRLARLGLSSGDAVAAGQPIARIAPASPPLLDARARELADAQLAAAIATSKQASAQLDRALAAREHALAQLARAEVLWQGGATTALALDEARLARSQTVADLESARFGSEVAKHGVRAARAALARMTAPAGAADEVVVEAPVAGRVLRVLHPSEGVVEASAPLYEIGDPDALEIVTDVLTRDAVRIARGATATIERWGGAPLAARVRLVEPSAFTRLGALGVEEQRVDVILEIESPRADWRGLGDGFAVETVIAVWRGDDVVQVPASAVFRHGHGWAVFRVDGDTARITPVEVGQRAAGSVQITAGLAVGQEVVDRPGDRVTEGAEVARR
jgi:HlyD family secretion protein